jgi:hypothetical protein
MKRRTIRKKRRKTKRKVSKEKKTKIRSIGYK